jgi:hypothetical protein
MDQDLKVVPAREPWNKGKLVGQKSPLSLKDIWAIRTPARSFSRSLTCASEARRGVLGARAKCEYKGRAELASRSAGRGSVCRDSPLDC